MPNPFAKMSNVSDISEEIPASNEDLSPVVDEETTVAVISGKFREAEVVVDNEEWDDWGSEG